MPSVPSDPAIIFGVSIIDFILSNLYPHEFFDTFGNFLRSIFFEISKTFCAYFLLCGN